MGREGIGTVNVIICKSERQGVPMDAIFIKAMIAWEWMPCCTVSLHGLP